MELYHSWFLQSMWRRRGLEEHKFKSLGIHFIDELDYMAGTTRTNIIDLFSELVDRSIRLLIFLPSYGGCLNIICIFWYFCQNFFLFVFLHIVLILTTNLRSYNLWFSSRLRSLHSDISISTFLPLLFFIFSLLKFLTEGFIMNPIE